MKRMPAVLVAPFLMAQAGPPLVPEGVHKLSNGPTTICGISATTAVEFQSKVASDPQFSMLMSDDRFIAYQTSDGMTQWVFSKAGNTAHPLATCRAALKGNDGYLRITRNMRCDDTRDNCDRAFLEFQNLDQQLKEAIAARAGR